MKITASRVLTSYIRHRNFPTWTAFYIQQKQVKNDRFGLSHFNWEVDGHNYHVLRTGCYPFIKYHCTKSPLANLKIDNLFYGVLKVMNLGVPTLLYGIAGLFLANHKEYLNLDGITVELRFWYKETW